MERVLAIRLAVVYVGATNIKLVGYLISINDETGWGVVLLTNGRLSTLESLREKAPADYQLEIQHV